jgi:hypothetical protein
MRVQHSILMLKALLVTLQTMLFSLLILELAPFSSYFVKTMPEVNVYTIMAIPLFLLFMLAIYLTLKGMSPSAISLTLLLVHTLTAFTYIISVSVLLWTVILIIVLLSMDLGSRLAMMRSLVPQDQVSHPGDTIPAMKGYEQYLRGDMLHPPDAFKVFPHGVLVALVLFAFAGSMFVFAQQALFIVLTAAVFVFPMVLVLLLVHSKDDDGREGEASLVRHAPAPLAPRWSTHER